MVRNAVFAIARKVLPPSARNFLRPYWNKVVPPIDGPADRSQAGEITLLRKLAEDFECQKWIIDVGANDGVTISNSLPFVELGWRAILIEPAPAVFKKLVANCGGRDNVTCLQIACCDKSGEADLYFGMDGEEGFMSTLCKSDNEWFRSARSAASVTVKTETITNILRRCGAPSNPGILLVDCEGMDYEALLGLDFEQFRPTVIVTEEYEWEPEKHATKYGLLIRANYSLVQKVGYNTVWVDRSAKPLATYQCTLC
jgi:FkbM family methyltransferase